MRIVVATTTGFHLRHLAVQLLGRGHDVTFISYLPRWKTASYGLPASATRSLFLRLQPAASLALLRGGRRLEGVRERLLAATDRAIARIVPPCDVFIGLSAMAVESARAARERHGAHIVIERGSSHVRAQARLVQGEGFAGLTPFYIDRELASYAVADRVVVPSRFAARTFTEEGVPENRVTTIMLGVDLGRFRAPPVPPPLPIRVLFVGQWSRRKGADLLAEAIARMPGLNVTHVGLRVDVPFPESSRFQSLGYLDHDALNRAMEGYHLLVLPSREDGFGMVMTEALAAGLRVVASDATGAPDLADALGPARVTVFRAGSVDALIAALQAASTAIEHDPVGYRPTAAEVDQLSWSHYGARYDAFLTDLAAGSRP